MDRGARRRGAAPHPSPYLAIGRTRGSQPLRRLFWLLSSVAAERTTPQTLPWPFAWLHAPKTGSHFGAAVADLLCDGLRSDADHGFFRFKGTELVDKRSGRTRCAANQYFGRATVVELLPHCVEGQETFMKWPPYCAVNASSFANGHFPSTLRGGRFQAPTLLVARRPEERLRSMYRQGLEGWCEGARFANRQVRHACRFPEEKKKRRPANICAGYLAWTELDGVLGCQTKMVLGRPCSGLEAPSEAETREVEALVLAENTSASNLIFVGDTARWDQTICLFYALFSPSGRCPPEETLLPAAKSAPRSDGNCTGGRRDVADDRLFAAAARRFDRDWAEAAHLVRHCPACARVAAGSADGPYL